MRKIILFLKRLFRRVNNIFYVGSSDILPEPLSKEEETNYVLLFTTKKQTQIYKRS